MADAPLAPADVVRAGLCIGCGVCGPDRQALDWDDHGFLQPRGRWTEQASEGFTHTCPFSPAARNEDEIAATRFPSARERHDLIGNFESAYVGHVAEAEFRPNGSSGGMVSWVAAELLRRGLVDGVAHVAPTDPQQEGRFFGYRISRSVEEIGQGAKSRYYPVELSGVLAEIRATPGRYAVIGVPCFIKALQLLRATDPVLKGRIAYTLGLFCGHMKSARLVDSFAWQLDAPIDQVRAVEYRKKDAGRPANWYTAHLALADGSARWQDWWHLVDGDWGAGFFQNNACNYCDDVVAETADIAFGDAWVEPYSSDGRGTNVVIVRTSEMQNIVSEALAAQRLTLEQVDAEFIANTQAAGFRQRREGLAYRLRIAPPRLPLRKRVAPAGHDLPLRRKLVYRSRKWISATSHRLAALGRRNGWHGIYLRWARLALRTYEGFAYLRGPVGRLMQRLEPARPD
ncbi:coenzyme F420 hydrogenase [Sphingomonas sp. ID1715]|uniref:Coenzyme F420 hydrogenase/dehydrogenase, beta subunit C-terminal domain n=1 Tax=Sphingomonas sp. ID1715 TaxID=1656898 RepID=UPI0017D8F320|nr:Coenzyme F420 hydrogenase/dehydrogenase, beta subunit C-terminal domain [Sphingomonas sp. ID1715]NNM78640.1 coenzyme F420 hydrogenase [Sphingomonas sp. ID1715]